MSDARRRPGDPRRDDLSRRSAPSLRLGRFLARLAAEFAVIVLGVLTALAADEWVQERADRELEAEYLERLRDDVAGHLGEIEQTAQLNLWGLRGGRELLDLLESGEWKGLSPESLVPLVLRASTNVQLNSGLATYDEILGSYETCVTAVDRTVEAITRPFRTENACTLDLEDWSPAALIATLDSPATLLDLKASIYYQQTSSGSLTTHFEPAARHLEQVIAEALENR